jgi:hypothetical protein
LNDTSRAARVAEIVKCGKDPVYFMKKYCKIQHQLRGMIPFETYPFQDDCVKQFQENRFNIVLKSRQLGLSTVTAAYALWFALFKKDKNILVIATKMKTAMNFIKKVHVMLDNLPTWILLAKFEKTKQSARFDNGSSITAIPTSPDAGRSEALALLIIDEAAWIKDFDEIWTGLKPTMSTGGSAILLSTPNGVGGQYHQIWVDAEARLNEFNPIRLPWNVHPEHDEAWFIKESKSLDKKKIAQEFECNFNASGDTFLSQEVLGRLREAIEQPSRREGNQSQIWIWKDPRPGARYILTADVSRGDSDDFSTFHVVDYDTAEMVCEFMGRSPPDKLADLMIEYGTRYNGALLAPELNSFGYFTSSRLRDSGYSPLYYASCRDDHFTYKPSNPKENPGFTTNLKTRPQMLGSLEEMTRNGQFLSRSQRLFEQLQTFTWHGNKATAMVGYHDDLVMSAAAACWLSRPTRSVERVDDVEATTAMLRATSKETRSSEGLPLSVTGLGTDKVIMTTDRRMGRPLGPGMSMDYRWLLTLRQSRSICTGFAGGHNEEEDRHQPRQEDRQGGAECPPRGRATQVGPRPRRRRGQVLGRAGEVQGGGVGEGQGGVRRRPGQGGADPQQDRGVAPAVRRRRPDGRRRLHGRRPARPGTRLDSRSRQVRHHSSHQAAGCQG